MIFANMYAMGTQVSAIIDIFRNLFFFIDGIVYSLIPLVYNLIFSLYDLNTLFNDNGATLSKIVTNMKTTVYSFIAIVMFFRVAVSLLTMLVDPSLIEHKEKGAGKIVLNIAICLVLIVVVPVLFRVAKDIQTRAMNEHWIEKIVIGDDFGTNERYTLGNELALSTWSVFLNPVDANSAVTSAYNSIFNDERSIGIGAVWPITKLYVVLNSTSGVPILSDIVGKIFPTANDVLNLFDSGTHYQLSYIWLLSTIVGIYVLSSLLKMMIDVAYRSLKFFALELLSPIAIISYIDPNSSQKGLFSKWSNEVFKTYLSLFIRIFVLALASVLLRAFKLSDLSANSLTNWTGNTLVVKLIYVLAATAFIKNAPKMIDDLFGTTISKGSDTKSAHQLLGGLLGGAALATAGSISGAVIAKATGKNAATGALKGAWQGAKKGYDAGKKGGMNGMVGVVEGGFGVVQDQKKKYGYSVDKERERRINNLEGKVDAVDRAKKDAIADLDANGKSKYLDILRTGKKYNGRTYGKGLEHDDTLENMIKKNAGGLARDEILHAGDQGYLDLRRLKYEQDNGAALAERTLENAKQDYSDRRSRFDTSTDKKQVYIEYATKHARNIYADMDEAALRAEFERLVGAQRDSLLTSGNNQAKIDFIVSQTGADRTTVQGMSDAQLDASIQTIASNKISNYGAASDTDKMSQLVDITTSNISQDISGLNDAEVGTRFDKLNLDLIESTYGNTYGNIESDYKKAKGDADAAGKALEDYVKTRGIGDIDSDYAIADSRHKAKVQAQQRNGSNGNNTP